MTINIIITNIVNNTQFSPIPFNVYKRSKRNTKSIKIVFKHGLYIVYLHTSTAYGQQLFIRQIIILIPRIKRNLIIKPLRPFIFHSNFLTRKFHLSHHKPLIFSMKDIQFDHKSVFIWNLITSLRN